MASTSWPATRNVIAVVVSAMASLGAISTASAQPPQTGAPPAAADASEPLTSELTVTVIGTTPLPGVGLPADEIPAPVRVLSSQTIEASGALDVASLLNRRLGGVHINELQGNPYQADVNYRGYTASPLLGTPQGLSIYFDGVRLNQPFGDVVSWDLIPTMAISSTVMMPGSNPLFGLNTLGGALAIQTKDGHVAPGTSVEATYGSNTRRAFEVEHGGSRPSGLHWYVAGNLFGEDGWRDHSPTTVRQLFGKVGSLRNDRDLTLSAAYADNSLTGNGLQEIGFANRDYASVYTTPDVTDNRAALVNLTARRDLRRALTLSANAYYRHIETETLNGDLNEESLTEAVYQPTPIERAALLAAGYRDVPASGESAENTPFPYWRCLANVLLNTDPAAMCNALLNRTGSVQHNAGASGQLTFRRTRERRHQLAIGAVYDRSHVDFTQSSEFGYLDPDRSVTGTGAFADGSQTGGTVSLPLGFTGDLSEPLDARVDLTGITTTWSAYATDAWQLGRSTHVSLSGRFNQTTVDNRDAIQPGGGPGSLDGRHTFSRFNPAIGVTFAHFGAGPGHVAAPPKSSAPATPSPPAAPRPESVQAPGSPDVPTPPVSPALPSPLTVYLGYSEGSRAPTSIELGCADPQSPCRLPNALAGDPPLDHVVTRTIEAGLRGHIGRTNWSAGLFRAINDDDILFVASGQSGFGHFRNFGQTRRQGVELAVDARIGRLTLGTGYTLLDATYRSEETVDGEGNSTNDAAEDGNPGVDGAIAIEPGDRIPLVPRHLFKAFADASLTSKLNVNVDLVAVSSAFARGNENNQHEPLEPYYLGPGATDGYAVVNLGGRFKLTTNLHAIVRIDNLFDRRYFTAAQLGVTGFTDSATYVARPFPPVDGEYPLRHSTFLAPGAPRRAWAGVRLEL